MGFHAWLTKVIIYEELQEIIDEADDLEEAKYLLNQYQETEKQGHTYRIVDTSESEAYLDEED